MPLILKVMHGPEVPGDSAPYSLYGDIRSASFYTQGSEAFARCYVLDPIKTATVPGFSEHEVHISLTGSAYVMNEAGKTVSRYEPGNALVADRIGSDGPTPLPGWFDERDLTKLPYDIVATLRRAAQTEGNAAIIAALDRQRVAVDA